MPSLAAFGSALGLGFLYFISAVPGGVALGLPAWLAALAAWLGYSAGGFLVAFGGAPLRDWLTRKLRIHPDPERPNLVLRAWRRFGLPGLGLLAPVTVGPQAGALIALALGARPWPATTALSLGALPWAAGFALAISLGVRLAR